MKIEIDLPKSTVEQAELIAHEAKLASRNDAIQWSISIASQITEARMQGFKVMLTKEEKKPKELILGEANVQPQNGGQMISIQLSPENMVRLREISENPNHPAASAVQALARTVFQPTLRKVEATFIFVLIYQAIRSGDECFLSLVRDIVTVLVATNYDSFQALVNAEHYKPQFDLNKIEQQFLSDEYLKAKHKMNTEEA